MNSSIYLDHAATTPVRPEVFEAMKPFLRGQYGNPSSVHSHGRAAKDAVDWAREQVAALLNCEPREIVFTSGGTEANNLALSGILSRRPSSRRRLLVSAVEHHAILRPAQVLGQREGVETVELPVEPDGRVPVEAVEEALDDSAALVSIMTGNNETGALQPISAIAALCAERGVHCHTDAVQAGGVIPLDVRGLPVSTLSLSAHKINGPKGVGACFVRENLQIAPQLLGGAQERARRGGTENVPGIVGFGKACELVMAERSERAERLRRLRDSLQQGILDTIDGAYVNGNLEYRLPQTLNVGFPQVDGESLLLALDTEGIAASSGAACSSGSVEPSHVLLAMGLDVRDAQSAIRFSFGWGNTEADVEQVLSTLQECVPQLRTGVPF